mgnify:CR=1 FL=1
MGKLKSAAQDWLDDYGYELGFDSDSLPSKISDWDIIVNNNVKVWEYLGKTKKEYYGG